MIAELVVSARMLSITMSRDVTRRIPNGILLIVFNKSDISQVEKSKFGSVIENACSTQ